jgi:hypothetical protein
MLVNLILFSFHVGGRRCPGGLVKLPRGILVDGLDAVLPVVLEPPTLGLLTPGLAETEGPEPGAVGLDEFGRKYHS